MFCECVTYLITVRIDTRIRARYALLSLFALLQPTVTNIITQNMACYIEFVFWYCNELNYPLKQHFNDQFQWNSFWHIETYLDPISSFECVIFICRITEMYLMDKYEKLQIDCKVCCRRYNIRLRTMKPACYFQKAWKQLRCV